MERVLASRGRLKRWASNPLYLVFEIVEDPFVKNYRLVSHQ
jgi:hypothetical protein